VTRWLTRSLSMCRIVATLKILHCSAE
jgi:hypothetical protein